MIIRYGSPRFTKKELDEFHRTGTFPKEFGAVLMEERRIRISDQETVHHARKTLLEKPEKVDLAYVPSSIASVLLSGAMKRGEAPIQDMLRRLNEADVLQLMGEYCAGGYAILSPGALVPDYLDRFVELMQSTEEESRKFHERLDSHGLRRAFYTLSTMPELLALAEDPARLADQICRVARAYWDYSTESRDGRMAEGLADLAVIFPLATGHALPLEQSDIINRVFTKEGLHRLVSRSFSIRPLEAQELAQQYLESSLSGYGFNRITYGELSIPETISSLNALFFDAEENGWAGDMVLRFVPSYGQTKTPDTYCALAAIYAQSVLSEDHELQEKTKKLAGDYGLSFGHLVFFVSGQEGSIYRLKAKTSSGFETDLAIKHLDKYQPEEARRVALKQTIDLSMVGALLSWARIDETLAIPEGVAVFRDCIAMTYLPYVDLSVWMQKERESSQSRHVVDGVERIMYRALARFKESYLAQQYGEAFSNLIKALRLTGIIPELDQSGEVRKVWLIDI